MLSCAARASSSRSIPGVRSTFTRRTGRTTVNWLVKYPEISSPRDAFSAISSALGTRLNVFRIALLFLLSRFPSGDQVVVLAFRVVPDLKDNGAQPATAPSNRAELLWIVRLSVDKVCLVEDFLCSSRLTPCFRCTSRLLRGPNSKRMRVYNCYTTARLAFLRFRSSRRPRRMAEDQWGALVVRAGTA